MNEPDLVTIIGGIPIDERSYKELEGTVLGTPRFLDNGNVEFRVTFKDGGHGVVNVQGPSEATAQIQFATDRDWPVDWQFVPSQGKGE